MKECAAVAEQYAHIISGVPYMGNPNVFPPLANGQYPMPMMAPMAQDEQGKKRKSRGEDGEGKRRAKKPKDVNAPKRPASSYLLFQNDVRNELKQKNPGMRNNELLSTISKLWSDMPQAQKDVSTRWGPEWAASDCFQVYEARNKELKDQWRAEKAAYESGKAGASTLPVSVNVSPMPITTHLSYDRLLSALPSLPLLHLPPSSRLFLPSPQWPRRSLLRRSPRLKRMKIRRRSQAQRRRHLQRRSQRRRLLPPPSPQ